MFLNENAETVEYRDSRLALQELSDAAEQLRLLLTIDSSDLVAARNLAFVGYIAADLTRRDPTAVEPVLAFLTSIKPILDRVQRQVVPSRRPERLARSLWLFNDGLAATYEKCARSDAQDAVARCAPPWMSAARACVKIGLADARSAGLAAHQARLDTEERVLGAVRIGYVAASSMCALGDGVEEVDPIQCVGLIADLTTLRDVVTSGLSAYSDDFQDGWPQFRAAIDSLGGDLQTEAGATVARVAASTTRTRWDGKRSRSTSRPH